MINNQRTETDRFSGSCTKTRLSFWRGVSARAYTHTCTRAPGLIRVIEYSLRRLTGDREAHAHMHSQRYRDCPRALCAAPLARCVHICACPPVPLGVDAQTGAAAPIRAGSLPGRLNSFSCDCSEPETSRDRRTDSSGARASR